MSSAAAFVENTASLGGDGVDDYCDVMMMIYYDYDDDYDDDDKNSFVKLMLMLFVKSEDEIWRNYWQRPAQC